MGTGKIFKHFYKYIFSGLVDTKKRLVWLR